MKSSELKTFIDDKALSGVYLLHGEEELMKDRALSAMIKAMIPEGMESMNMQTLDESATLDDLKNAVQTLPFLVPSRVVICRNYNALNLDKRQFGSEKTKDMIGDIGAIMDHLDDSCILIFLQRGAVGKDQPLFKAIKKRKRDVAFAEPKAAEKQTMVASLAKQMGLKIKVGEIRFLLDYTDANIMTLNQELQKLQASSDGNPITKEAIMAVCTPSMQYNVFTMIRAITQNQASQALSILRDMLQENENPGGILLLLERQFRTLIYISDIKKSYAGAVNYKELEKKLNVKDFVIKNMMRWEYKVKEGERQAIINWCADADYLHKQGIQNDVAAVESLVMKLLYINSRK